MRITKHRHPFGWRISVDRRETDILISKGAAPRYREPQMYDVTLGDIYLFEARGVGSAIETLEIIAAELFEGIPR